MVAVDLEVAPLIKRIGALKHRLARPDFGERAADQVLRALADRAAEERALDTRQPELSQHGVEHHVEVAQRVDHRAVEVDDRCPQFGQVHPFTPLFV